MSLLSDRDIAREVVNGGLRISPWRAAEQLQPASYDCRLGDELLVPTVDCWVDPQSPQGDRQLWNRLHMEAHQVPLPTRRADVNYAGSIPTVGGFWLAPGQFVLGSTQERFELPDYLSARIEGKSSLGRWGLIVHVTAGFVDPGFRGQLTLELRNVGPFNLLLRPGMRISQVSFTLLSSRVERSYGDPALGSKYQGQDGAQGAL